MSPVWILANLGLPDWPDLNTNISCRFDDVIHYADFKAFGESCANPLPYYINNILGALNLLDVMNRQR